MGKGFGSFTGMAAKLLEHGQEGAAILFATEVSFRYQWRGRQAAGGPGFEPRLTESESAPTEAVVGVLRCPIVTNMAEYATASGSAEMVTPKNRLAGGEAPLQTSKSCP
jgi:hypothetical protein